MKKILWLLLGVLITAFSLLGCGAVDVVDAPHTELVEIENEAGTETPIPDSPEEVVPDASEEVQPEGAAPVEPEEVAPEEAAPENENEIQEDGQYTDKDSVALYIHTYGKLPSNYITKNEARDLGWDNKENSLDQVLPGMSIGGDRFGNYEGLLPEKNGRVYRECDIDYEAGSRNAKRIVFSNDGLIFYTGDHYKSFVSLY